MNRALIALPLFLAGCAPENQPYSSWPLERTVTKKRCIRNPPEVAFSGWTQLPADINAGRFSSQATIDVTNNFSVPLGSVSVTAQFKNAQGVIIDEQYRSTGAMQPKAKWQLSFSVPSGAVHIETSDVLADEP